MLWNLSEGHQKTDEQNIKMLFEKIAKLFIKSFLLVLVVSSIEIEILWTQ